MSSLKRQVHKKSYRKNEKSKGRAHNNSIIFRILTTFLQQTKPFVIILRAPMDNGVSQILASICDTG